MAKILVEDQEDQTSIPFLRGILIRSLQDAGIVFKDAYELSTAVRTRLDRAKTIRLTSIELRELVIAELTASTDPETVNRYKQKKTPIVIHVEQRDGQLIPFSRLEYQHQLENIGIEGDEAAAVVGTVYKHLLDRHIELITSRRLGELTYRYLRHAHELGPAVAKRWLIWRDFINSGRPLIYLIGGTAGSGKSTIASMLASRLEIVRTQSTDMLREVMRTMVPEQLLPVLHKSSFTAWSALPEQRHDPEKTAESSLIDGYLTQANLLSVAIEAVIQRGLRERVSLILEGVHIHPLLISKLEADSDAVVIPIMVSVLKRKRLQRQIRGRGTDVPQRRAERYLKHFEDIWHLQSYLLSEADSTNMSIVINEDRDKVFREVMRITIDVLAKDFTGTSKTVFS
ncbi:MAG: zeta toxin family protein [Thiohalobacterales bacterium]